MGSLFDKVNPGRRVETARALGPHSMRAQFVGTYRNGVPDKEITGHTRNRNLATLRANVRWGKSPLMIVIKRSRRSNELEPTSYIANDPSRVGAPAKKNRYPIGDTKYHKV
jgi:hypothetical protein